MQTALVEYFISPSTLMHHSLGTAHANEISAQAKLQAIPPSSAAEMRDRVGQVRQQGLVILLYVGHALLMDVV